MPPSGPDSRSVTAPDDVAELSPRIVVVSDAGPLISLGRLDLIGLLGALFAEVQVPEVVIRECLARPGNADTVRIRHALAQQTLVPCPTPLETLAGLDPGESAVIVHAKAIGAAVLMDERAGRARAQSMGLKVTGTLGVLVRARLLGLVSPLGPHITALRASGQRLSRATVRRALNSVGESGE